MFHDPGSTCLAVVTHKGPLANPTKVRTECRESMEIPGLCLWEVSTRREVLKARLSCRLLRVSSASFGSVAQEEQPQSSSEPLGGGMRLCSLAEGQRGWGRGRLFALHPDKSRKENSSGCIGGGSASVVTLQLMKCQCTELGFVVCSGWFLQAVEQHLAL